MNAVRDHIDNTNIRLITEGSSDQQLSQTEENILKKLSILELAKLVLASDYYRPRDQRIDLEVLRKSFEIEVYSYLRDNLLKYLVYL